MTAFPPEAVATLETAYPETPALLRHDLAGHELLTLEALVRLAAALPEGSVEYNLGALPIGIDPADIPRPSLSITDTIRGIEENGSWMVLKRIDQHPAYAALLEATLAEIRPLVAARTGAMLGLEGFIFVSSADAVTPFHFDPEHNILLQIRGEKTFTIFPQTDESIVAPQLHEAYHLGEHHRNLPWQDGFAQHGTPFAMEPGDALHVPVKAPHWVRVTEGPSISLSVTWRSEWSYEEADARAFNRLLRRMGVTPASPVRLPGRNRLRSFAFRGLRRLGVT